MQLGTELFLRFGCVGLLDPRFTPSGDTLALRFEIAGIPEAIFKLAVFLPIAVYPIPRTRASFCKVDRGSPSEILP